MVKPRIKRFTHVVETSFNFFKQENTNQKKVRMIPGY